MCAMLASRLKSGCSMSRCPSTRETCGASYLQETIDAYCRAEGEGALDAAKKALQAAGFAFEVHLLTGHAGQTIAQEALRWGCTRIVMGTRGQGALANVMLGSTALQVMHLSDIPITLVK